MTKPPATKFTPLLAATLLTISGCAGGTTTANTTPASIASSSVLGLSDLRHSLNDLSVVPSSPNSAGGVDAEIRFKNNSVRTIKYVRISMTPYNAVDDPVASEIGRRSLERIEITGPIAPGDDVGRKSSKPLWYNPSIKAIRVTAVEIEYTTGEPAEFEFPATMLS